MGRIWNWVSTFNTVASVAILLGVPVSVFTAIGAALWGHFEKLRISYILVLILLVFALSLWSWIGLLWLFERAKPKRPENEKPAFDCAWGLLIDAAFISIDHNGPLSHQVTLQIRNRLDWPLRFEILDQNLIIENRVPDKMLEKITPAIIMPNAPLGLNLHSYSKGTLPTTGIIKGTIEIKLCYGHPDNEYTRIMTRWIQFQHQSVNPPIQPGFPGTAILPFVLGGKFPLSYGPTKEDEDKPYSMI